MKTTEDPKSKWPWWMKEQYNEEIRRRNALKRIELERQRVLDERYCPEIWRFPLNETTVFSMLAYVFKFNYVIERILQKYFQKEDRKKLMVSSEYLYMTRNVFPGYYSDRERVVVMLNRYRVTGDIEGFIKWLPFHSDRTSLHLINLMVGLFFLDQYLNDLKRQEFLRIALSHLTKGQKKFHTMEARLAFNSLIAFAHYMNQDFMGSKLCVVKELSEDEEFQEKFLELIDKEAA